MNNKVKLCLFDDYWIESRKGTIRRWFEPQVAARYVDNHYELNCYSQLICDREHGRYRLFYEVLPDMRIDSERYLALAEGNDLNMLMPVNLDDNLSPRMRHIVFTGKPSVHGASVILDTFDPDPRRRYKFAGMTSRHRGNPKGSWFPVVLAFSPDGISWEHHPEMIAHPSTSDAYNQIFYNPYAEKYALIHRGSYVDRRIMIKTSSDLINWSPSRLVLQPGPHSNDDAIQTTYYSMSTSYQDGIFLGVVWRFCTNLQREGRSKLAGYTEPELVYSHDGEYFQLAGRPMVRRPLPPDYGNKELWLTSICESLDGKEYIVTGTGTIFDHGAPDALVNELKARYGNTGATLFYTIRKDGFCGIEGLGDGSAIVFRPMSILEGELSFNIRANCGLVRFAMMKKDWSFYDGFSYDHCIPYQADDGLCVVPRWKDHQISELYGKQVRIGIELNNAILHAVSATARPCIVQPQVGFHDPRQLSS